MNIRQYMAQFGQDEERLGIAIDNPDAVKDAYGKHVKLTVTADAASKSVHVNEVSVLAN